MHHLSKISRVLLIALLASCPSFVRAQANPAQSLIANSGMEIDADGDAWPDEWPRLNANGSWEAEEGNHFIRMVSTAPGKTVMLYREIPVPEGIQALELSWRWRVTKLRPGSKAWFDARIMMEFMDANRQKVSPGPSAPYTRRDTDGWQTRTLRFVVPEGARTLKFMPSLFNVNSGTLDLDDITLTPTDAAPLIAANEAAAAERAQKQAATAAARQEKAAAVFKASGSLITNGNLEAPNKGGNWPADWGSAKAPMQSWGVEDGNHFIRLTATQPDKMTLVYRQINLPANTGALQLQWRWRVQNLKVGKLPWHDARIMVEFADASGKKIPAQYSAPYSRGTKGWENRSLSFLVPEGAVVLNLMPALFNVKTGTLDLDDFVLTPTDTAALEAAAKSRAEEAAARYVPPEDADRSKWPSELRADGNRLVDKSGKVVWLQGVNAGGMETLPQDTQPIKSTLVAIQDWKANAVRLPVKEEFWFGRNPIQKDGGKAYREHVDQCVMLAANRGAYLILDLHRFRAPKAEHADFWRDAATRYANHPAVIFDLFNEPHDISWKVWKDGGWVGDPKKQDESAFLSESEKKANEGFQSIGMQALVDAVRSTGARNLVVASGVDWSGNLSGVADGYALRDPSGNGIMYAWHIYNWHKDWAGRVLAAARKYPILVGEVGADVKKMDFLPADIQEDPYTWVPDMLGFIQKYQLNWTGWCFHPRATPVMISDWKYTPTPFWGVFAKEALSGKQFEMKRMR